MGKRLPKPALLVEINREREKLNALLDRLKPRQMTRPGATKAGWSVKEILGHVVAWQQLNLEWHSTEMRGESPEVPAPGYGWGDVRKLNEKIYRKCHRKSLNDVLNEFESYHRAMIDLMGEVSDRDFVSVGRYSWTGPTWTLSDYVRANTASHDRWASKHIRKWIRTITESVN